MHLFPHPSPRRHPCYRCATSVCRAATRARRGLPAANHTASGRPFIVLTHVLPGEEALLAPFAAATAALRLPTVALAAHVEAVAAAAANTSVQLVDEAELAAGQLKQAPDRGPNPHRDPHPHPHSHPLQPWPPTSTLGGGRHPGRSG